MKILNSKIVWLHSAIYSAKTKSQMTEKDWVDKLKVFQIVDNSAVHIEVSGIQANPFGVSPNTFNFIFTANVSVDNR